MYSVIKNRSAADIVTRQLPSLVSAFLIAETLYKFKSFSLECLAFLATWFVLDWAWTTLLDALGRTEKK